MKTHKFIICILMLSFVLTSLLSTITQTQASVKKQLYIQTEVAEEYDDFARSHLHEFLQSVSISDQIQLDDATLGTGFKVYGASINGDDLYYYPVILNEKISYIFKVYRDTNQSLVGSITSGQASEFNVLAEQTSYANPAVVIVSNDNMIAMTANQEVEISISANGMQLNRENIANLYQKALSDIVIDAFEKKEYSKINTRVSFRSLNVPIDYLDVQVDNEWCCAHVTANILRKLTGKMIYAKTITSYYGLGINTGLSFDQAKQYAATQGVNCSGYIGGKPSQLTIESNLISGKPLYGSMLVGGEGHAIVIHGCVGNTLKIRNPWNAYSETYNYDTNTYVSAGGTLMNMRGYMTFN